jgi:hypothetical protein
VRGVQLNDFKSGIERAAGSVAKCPDGSANLNGCELLRDLISVGEGDCTRCVDRGPSPLFWADGLAASPGRRGAGFTSGMRELGARDGALAFDECRNAGEEFDVLVFPNSEILGTDPAFGDNRIGFRKNDCCAAHRAAAEMNEMPVVGKAVSTRVLAHRRNDDAVGNRETTNGERFEQMRHKVEMNGNRCADRCCDSGLPQVGFEVGYQAQRGPVWEWFLFRKIFTHVDQKSAIQQWNGVIIITASGRARY